MKARFIDATIATFQIAYFGCIIVAFGTVALVTLQNYDSNKVQSNFEQLGSRYQEAFKADLKKFGL
ncbi:hypothetical protein RIVM261_080070 [Rivularia sp. IAM M-261]|nr:hypothetical protein RIVM261_080070 [Rivularia sp. IAM M-261]